MTLKENISQAVVNHVKSRYAADLNYGDQIINAVSVLLHGSGYVLPSTIATGAFSHVNRDDDFQESLAKINEKEARRKKEGVYYTDRDVTDFLAANTLLHYVDSRHKEVYDVENVSRKLSRLQQTNKYAILSATVFDPTCGAGEFLLSIISMKLELMMSVKSFSPYDLACSIYGNDIEQQSTEITKLRVFFLIIDSLPKIDNLEEIVLALNRNFTNNDAVLYDGYSFGKKDIVIGNPPYVEYRNFQGKPAFDYGNVYADVLHHSVDMLNDKGIMAFVIPLSYVSTVRMKKIREHISSMANKQIVLNFADRPDCLFSCVHQKLTIVVAQKDADFSGTLSSSYNYWYHSERASLFNGLSLIATDTTNDAYWPKLGNRIENEIYNKFKNLKGKSILNYSITVQGSSIYLNQRGCFWMKAFTRDMRSSSYTCYNLPKELSAFAYCVINSSLFFLLWIIISDGWHITNKELSFLKFPKEIGDVSVWESLAKELEDKLEETKVYVGTKQVDYEYKHKYCKEIIDRIDDQLRDVYKLSLPQLEYIKNFALKYRISDGSKD